MSAAPASTSPTPSPRSPPRSAPAARSALAALHRGRWRRRRPASIAPARPSTPRSRAHGRPGLPEQPRRVVRPRRRLPPARRQPDARPRRRSPPTSTCGSSTTWRCSPPAGCPRRGGCPTRGRLRWVSASTSTSASRRLRSTRSSCSGSATTTPPTSSTPHNAGWPARGAAARDADQHRRRRADHRLRRRRRVAVFPAARRPGRAAVDERRARRPDRPGARRSALPMLGGDLDYFGPGSPGRAGALAGAVGPGAARRHGRRASARSIWPGGRCAISAWRARVPPSGSASSPTACCRPRRSRRGSTTPATPQAGIEDRIRRWGLAWRAGAAAAARAANAGRPSARYRRPAGRAGPACAEPALASAADRRPPSRSQASARDVRACRRCRHRLGSIRHGAALRDVAAPLAPIAPAPAHWAPARPAARRAGRPRDLLRTVRRWSRSRCTSRAPKLGLVGHLVRESLIAAAGDRRRGDLPAAERQARSSLDQRAAP